MKSVRLFSYFVSSCSWRVRLALQLKKVPHTIVPVQLTGNAQGEDAQQGQFDPVFAQYNPMREVPLLALETHDGTVTRTAQSMAVLELLDELFPDTPLLPPKPEDPDDVEALVFRAKARQMAEIVNSGIQPYQSLMTLRQLDAGAQGKFVRHFISRGLAAFARLQAETPGPLSMGSTITLPDVLLVPQLAHARRFRVPLDGLTELLDIEDALKDHPAFHAAHPLQQPDCPEDVLEKMPWLAEY